MLQNTVLNPELTTSSLLGDQFSIYNTVITYFFVTTAGARIQNSEVTDRLTPQPSLHEWREGVNANFTSSKRPKDSDQSRYRMLLYGETL